MVTVRKCWGSTIQARWTCRKWKTMIVMLVTRYHLIWWLLIMIEYSRGWYSFNQNTAKPLFQSQKGQNPQRAWELIADKTASVSSYPNRDDIGLNHSTHAPIKGGYYGPRRHRHFIVRKRSGFLRKCKTLEIGGIYRTEASKRVIVVVDGNCRFRISIKEFASTIVKPHWVLCIHKRLNNDQTTLCDACFFLMI